MGGIESHMAICPARGPYGHTPDERIRDKLGGHSPVAAIGLADHECDEARGEPGDVAERQHLPGGEMHRHGWKTLGWIGTPFSRERTELAKEESGAKCATTRVGRRNLRRRLFRPLAHKNMAVQFACPGASATYLRGLAASSHRAIRAP
jgi:hypothetical protein